MINIKSFIDYLGLYAPIILFIFTLLLLRNMYNYLTYFLFGFIINNALNIILKLLIKEPRPFKDNKAIEIGIVNGSRISFDKFGMPSGHSQNCAFFVIFITMVLNNPSITVIYSCITFISLFQRYLYNNHTLLQLFVGFIIGSFVGYMTYNFANIKIKGEIKSKQDDNGPI
jgi:membrane-associated phospholipid phosphatase